MEPHKPLKILLLAPHPFYQERGTPIALDLLLTALSRRGCRVDVITFPEGEDRNYPGVRIHRLPRIPGVGGIRPGFSVKKLLYDFLLCWSALYHVVFNRPDVIHAVEESVYPALLFRAVLRVPYLYDMDSSLAAQLVEKMAWLAPCAGVLRWFEALAIRHALVVVPVCDALVRIARDDGGRRVHLLTDVSLLPDGGVAARRGQDSRFNFMYVGNLEVYQGLDLLLAAFRQAAQQESALHLIVVGGVASDVARYKRIVEEWGIAERVTFTGPRPLSDMAKVFEEADVLVSPRIKGVNTPMKIYSYLDSGRPVLATDLPTHTQVLTADVAALVEPKPEAMAAAMLRLHREPAWRHLLAERGHRLARQRYSRSSHEESVNALYNNVENLLRV